MGTKELRALQGVKDHGLAAVDSREAKTAPAHRSRCQAMAIRRMRMRMMRIWSWHFTRIPAGASPNDANASFTVILVGER